MKPLKPPRPRTENPVAVVTQRGKPEEILCNRIHDRPNTHYVDGIAPEDRFGLGILVSTTGRVLLTQQIGQETATVDLSIDETELLADMLPSAITAAQHPQERGLIE
jgi:hypothetical protein